MWCRDERCKREDLHQEHKILTTDDEARGVKARAEVCPECLAICRETICQDCGHRFPEDSRAVAQYRSRPRRTKEAVSP